MNTTRKYPRTLGRNVALVVHPGDRYGRLVIVEEAERVRKPSGVPVRVMLCRCDCGAEKAVRLSSLREGTTVSCGCFHKENVKLAFGQSSTTHGQSKTSLHMIWSAMKARCHNPANKSYPRYGARGVSVCQEWRDSFEAFAAYVGPPP